MGVARYFRRYSPRTRIVAVDTEGSITFGFPPGPRRIPGLGTSRRPEIFRPGQADETVLVPEADAIPPPGPAPRSQRAPSSSAVRP
jgi:cysteine synthase A